MKCELFFFYKEKDWKKIDKVLQSMNESFQVITTSESLNKFLLEKGIISKTFRDIFPEEDDVTYKIHSRSKEIQEEYRGLFKEVKYRDVEIFSGIENQLLDQIILYEKAKHVLKNNMDTIFVFEGFAFTYFAIKKLSIKMGYTNDDGIGLIRGDKISIINPSHRQRFLLLRNQWYSFKSQYIPEDGIKRLYKKFMAGEMISSYRHIIVNLIFYHIIRRTYGIPFPPSISKILKEIDKKMEIDQSTKDAVIGFFLTTNKEDLYLKSIYPILDKLKEKNQKSLVCIIDIQTKINLNKKGVSFLDLFDEINIIATNILKRQIIGKRISNQIKDISIKNEISIMYYDQLSESLIHEVFRTMAIIRICEHVFFLFLMKKIVIGTDGVMFGNSVISTAKKFNIQSFFIPGIIINKNPLHRNWYKADKICLYGKQGFESLKSLGYEEDQLIITGNPKYDFLKKLDSTKSKNQLMELHHVDSGKKLIVIGMARWHKGDEEWMSKLIQFCNKNNFEIVIKIHPMYKSMFKGVSTDKINSIKQKCKDLRYFITTDMDLAILLSAADLVITDYSNVGAEAVILEKPLLTVNFVKESFENEQRYHDFGAALYFEDYSRLEESITEILVSGKHVQGLEKGRKKMLEQYNFYNDGNATNRVIDLITNKTGLK